MPLVFYRKYRPQKFSEVIGQEHIVKTLTNALSSGLISHAYLFCGPRGCGKTTLARLFAKSLNCQNRKNGEGDETKVSSSPFSNARVGDETKVSSSTTRVPQSGTKGGEEQKLFDSLSHSESSVFEPCNQCSSCLEISQGKDMDLIEIDAASNRGIDDIRDLRDGIKFVPTKSKYKVFILDEAHQLTKEAANALLKTLEEPPSHAIFILATTEIHKMIPTIISRCQRFDFRKLTLPEITKRLEIIAEKEGVKIEKSALEMIGVNATGSIRDAESLFGQVLTFGGTLGRKGEIKAEDIKNLLGLVETTLVINLCDFLAQKKPSEAIIFVNELADSGVDLQEFNRAIVNYLRQALILKITGPEIGNTIITGLTKEEFQKLQVQTALFKEEELRKILNYFLEAENKIKYSSIIQLPLELAIIESCETA